MGWQGAAPDSALVPESIASVHPLKGRRPRQRQLRSARHHAGLSAQRSPDSGRGRGIRDRGDQAVGYRCKAFGAAGPEEGFLKVLVTGVAGFIGFHTAAALLERGDEVVGIDNLNDYYDVSLKVDRLNLLHSNDRFAFLRLDLCDSDGMTALFSKESFQRVVHLAAQAGVRYSIDRPQTYIDSNVVGMLAVLEGCRHHGTEHLVFASSSSVYGSNATLPFSARHGADHPLSLYAATKRSGELLAHSYASMHSLPVTGLRFFSVYGPFGRPDSVFFKFTKRILAGETVDLYHFGRHRRDFTYIDDVVQGVLGVLDQAPRPDPGWSASTPDPAASHAPFKIYNVGNQEPVEVLRLVEIIEGLLGRKAMRNLVPIMIGDVADSWSDTRDLTTALGGIASTSIEDGTRMFLEWYLDYYKITP